MERYSVRRDGKRFGIEALCLSMVLYGAPLQALEAVAPSPVEPQGSSVVEASGLWRQVSEGVGATFEAGLDRVESWRAQPWTDALAVLLATGAGEDPPLEVLTDAVAGPDDQRFDAVPPLPPGFRQAPTSARRAGIPGVAASPEAVLATKDHLDAIPMLAGWNLISLPEEPADPDPAVVLAPIAGLFNAVYGYDACDPTDPWKIYDPADAAASDLLDIDSTQGLWLEATAAASLPSAGTLAPTTSWQLCTGWNLIGYPAGEPRHVRNALQSIEGKYVRVFGFDLADPTDPWEIWDVTAPDWANDLVFLRPGFGYWVLVTEDTTLEIANQGPAPTVAITAPVDLAEVTAPTEIRGTVASPILERWTLSYRLVGEPEWVELATGAFPVTDAPLATFDPTRLINGLYEIRLEAVDLAGMAIDETLSVSVEGALKLGNFTLEYVDLLVNVAGLDLEVRRTYDSRRRDMEGDFGFGWALEVRQGTYRNNRPPGEGWQITDGFLPCETVNETKSHVTTIRLADREIYRFRARLAEGAPTLGGCFARASFELVDAPSPGATLEILGNDEVFYENASDRVIDTDTLAVFEPQGVRLTTRDGRVFDLDLDGGVTGLRDPFGNALTIDDSGITHSSGVSVSFVRDGAGRITEVVDTIGDRILYAYDGGDLVSVTDRADQVTQFSYLEGHFLNAIIDPRGVQGIRTEYDDLGRMVRVFDASGRAMELGHDLDARRETVVDRLGNVQLMEFDDRGNVVRQTNTLGEVTTRVFGARDRLLSETDPLGNRTSYTYDGAGDLLSITDPLGNRTSFTRDGAGRILTLTEPGGQVTTSRYGSSGELLEIEDATGAKRTFVYDTSGNRTQVIDPLGAATHFTYDGAGRLTRMEDAGGMVTSYTFDGRGNVTQQTTNRTAADGSTVAMVTQFTLDDLERVTRAVFSDGSELLSEYDPLGNPTASVDALGRRVTMTYDDHGRLAETRLADGSTETRSYDAEGRLTQVVDATGRSTSYTYDAMARPLLATHPGGATVGNTYDAAGRLVAVTNARGFVLRQEFDAAGRRTKMIDPLGGETTYTYDANGRQLSITDPKGGTVTSEYDAVGRVIRQTLPSGASRQVAWNAAGRKISETDELGAVTTFDYDPMGRLTSVTDAAGETTVYAYDEVGNKISVTDAAGRVTRQVYDDRRQVIQRILPDGTSDSVTYDAVGNVVTRTDFAGRVTQLSYDDRNRPVERILPGGAREQMTYNPTGTRATVTDARGTTTYSYDDRDRLTEVVYPEGQAIAHAYDAVGNRTEMTLRSGAHQLVTRTTYDALDRIQTIEDPDGRVYSYTYDAAGNRISTALPNGVRTDYTYDIANRLTALRSVETTSGTALQDYAYTLDASGRWSQVDELDGTDRDWTYDALYRVVGESVQVAGVTERSDTYAYDVVGNRTSFDSQGPAGVLESSLSTFDDRDRLLTQGGQSLSWDSLGQLLEDSDGTDYVWDSRGRLIEASRADGTRVENTYDADGLRVATRVEQSDGSAQEARLLIDTVGGLPSVVAELDESGLFRSYFVRGHGLLAVVRDLGPRYYLSDGLGSVRHLLDDGAVITDSYEYDAYGRLVDHQGSDEQPYLFAGEPQDPVTGTYYLRARWMDPGSGRFLTMDPFSGFERSPKSLHKYNYAEGDPVNFTDPTGLFSAANVAVTAAVIGVVASAIAGIAFHALAISNFPNDILTKPASAVIIGLQWSVAAGRLVRWIRHPVAVGLSLGLAFTSFLAMVEFLIPIKDPTRVWIYGALGIGIDPVTDRGPAAAKPSVYVGLAWNVESAGDYPGWSFCSGFSSHAISKKAGLPVNACSGLPADEHSDPAVSVTLNKFNKFGAIASTGAYYWYLGELAIPMEDVAPYIPTSIAELPGWLDRLGF